MRGVFPANRNGLFCRTKSGDEKSGDRQLDMKSADRKGAERQMEGQKRASRKLAEARADKGKILLRVSLRILLAGVVILAGIRGNPPNSGPVSFLSGLLAGLIVLGAAAWVFFPLLHCRDFLDFYEDGIVFCGRSWGLEDLGEISFMEVKSSYSLFARVYMCTEVRDFNVTYIKDGKRNFNNSYCNAI